MEGKILTIQKEGYKNEKIIWNVVSFSSHFFINAAEAKSLKKGEVYSLLNGRDTIEVISGSELEITKENQTFVAEYDFKGDKLRVVVNALGTKMVQYYLLTKEGLKDEKSGEIYYSKAELAALEEQRRREEEKRMVFVKGGCFQMGDTFGDGEADEKPVHEVCVDDFYMGKYEVTQKEWQSIMGNNPSHFKNCDTCPVENVSWNDVQYFIRKLNEKTKNNPQAPFVKGEFRLPTEAEWEYAARSGGKNEKWAGTSNESELGGYAWYDKNSEIKTHPVGQKAPNGLGIYDMSGNIWEWVQDWYDENYYKSSPRDNPKGASSGLFRVLRGGSWLNSARLMRAASRNGYLPDYPSAYRGFRVAVFSGRQ